MSGGWHLRPDSAQEWPGLDPYSHWLLTHGADFLPKTGEEDDHAPILGVVNRHTLLFGTKDGRFLSEVVNQVDRGVEDAPLDYARDAAQKAVSAAGGPFEETSHLIFRLPMRRASLPGNKLPGGKRAPPPEWELRFDASGTQPVIVAVIDDVMNIAHPRLRDSTGQTRVEFAWLQDADAPRGPDGSPVPFGREWQGRDIDGIVARHGRREDRVLAELGLRDFDKAFGAPLDRRYAHGAHVADLAAGAEPGSDQADVLRLITVALPQASTRETSGALLGFYVLTALQYILARARILQRAIGGPVPLIINFSYGITGGPHDGTHIIEELIGQAIAHEVENGDDQMPVTLVMPAGNNRLDRGHAMATAVAGADTVLSVPWRIQPGDGTPNYLEVWLPPGADAPRLRLTLPDGSELPVIEFSAHRAYLVTNGDHQTLARISFDQPQAGTGKRRILLAVVPTAPMRGIAQRRWAPAGLWHISVSAPLADGERIEAWIQRDAWPLRDKGEIRQSYFDHPGYVRFTPEGAALTTDPEIPETPVMRRGTLNGLATGRPPAAPVVVAAALGEGGVLADYSALADDGMIAGPQNGTSMFSAVAERSRNVRGVLASGSRCGAVVPLGGTSVAAPQVTRYLADAFINGRLSPADSAANWLADETSGTDGVIPFHGARAMVHRP